MSSTINKRDVLAAISALRQFKTRGETVHAEAFYRLSGDPTTLGMSPVERLQLLTARQINEIHYMPYCKVCGERIDYDTSAYGPKTWVHINPGHTHVPEQVSAPESYGDHPDGLAYVVYSQRHPLAWITNDGTWHLVQGDPNVFGEDTEHQVTSNRLYVHRIVNDLIRTLAELDAGPDVHAWADGHGVWWVRVRKSEGRSSLLVARERLRDELTARDAHVDRDVWLHPRKHVAPMGYELYSEGDPLT